MHKTRCPEHCLSRVHAFQSNFDPCLRRRLTEASTKGLLVYFDSMEASVSGKRVRLHDADGRAGALFKRVKETGAEGGVELPFTIAQVSAWERVDTSATMSVEDLTGALQV